MSRIFPFAFVLLLAAGASACGGGNDSPTAPTVNVPFQITDVRVGTGTEATNGRRVTVNYSGWLYAAGAVDNKGSLFDSSLTAGRTPFVFLVGGNQVIAGWERGIIGMRIGGQRRLIIPPELGYGTAGSGPIPGNATLVFDIELLSVQ